MLEKIEIGKTYLNSLGDEVKLFYRNDKEFCAKKVSKNELYLDTVDFLNDWKELPKEPKKLGQLGISKVNHPNGHGFDVIVGQFQLLKDNYDPELWQPCTLNVETGEVYSVE